MTGPLAFKQNVLALAGMVGPSERQAVVYAQPLRPSLAGTSRGKGELTPQTRPRSVQRSAVAHSCQEGWAAAFLRGRITVTKQKHFKRRVRERMEKTGESYTTARMHLLSVPADPFRSEHFAGEVATKVRLRRRLYSRDAMRRLRFRALATAFTFVLSLALGAAGFVTLVAADASGSPSSGEAAR